MFTEKNIYDISMEINEDMPLYPGTERTKVIRRKNYKDDGFNLTSISMSTHAGTHIDAPFHFINGGKKINDISLDNFIIKVQVVKINNEREITTQELKQKNIENSALLFKTINSKISDNSSFYKDYVSLNEKASRYLISKGIKFIGIDYLSVEKYENSSQQVHKLLLENEVILLEGLNLRKIKPDEYTLIALPLKIKDSEGTPVRAVLVE